MNVESKRRGRRVPAFGLALAAMLLLVAATASAASASTWHIDGATFSGEESVSWSGGPIKISRPVWGVTISCGTVSGTTKIKKSSESSGTITLGSCAVEKSSACTVKPLSLNYEGYLVDSGGQAYERYNVSGKWTITGTSCTLTEQPEVVGSIAAAVGVPDAVKSPRVFSTAAESATGASGLHFIGGYWKVSGEAQQSLAGVNTGKDFGIGLGGTWVPVAPATWTIGGSPFSGSEEIAWSKGTEPITLSTSAVTVKCTESSTYEESEISGGDESVVEVLLSKCGIATAPACTVASIPLTFDGRQLGYDEEGDVLEKADVSGQWAMAGTGCPFTGTKPISGSVGAALFPEGTVLRKYLGAVEDHDVKALGLRVNGETWHLNPIVSSTLIGANAGEEFGAE